MNHLCYKQPITASTMLYMGAGHGNNSEIIILKWSRYYIFCNNLLAKKKFKSEFVSDAISASSAI